MVSIASTMVLNQEQQIPGVQEEATRYKLVVRFGRDLLSDGFTALPNLLLDVYAELGITHCELVFILPLLQYKWSKAEPYPSLGTIATKMGLSIRAVQNHVHSLKNKAYQCPHTDEGEACSCPKYLVVTPRYRVGMGQTSNSYNLSGLFAAVLNLAREKGLLPQEDPAEKCTGPREASCMGGMKEPAPESDRSKNTQSEPDEPFSNALGGKDKVQVSCSHSLMATRNPNAQPEEKTEKESQSSTPSSKENMNTHCTVNPSQPSRAERSKTEPSRVQETGHQRQSFSGNDEVIGKRERVRAAAPRMTAPPLTQEEMDVRIRERLAREQARSQMQNPLPGIIPDQHWNQLEQDHPTASPSLRCKPMPVYPRLQERIERISQELGDFHHATSNITRTDNIRQEANVPLEQVLDVLSEAYHATRVAEQKGQITKRDEQGRLVKMSYFFAVLRQKLGLPPKPNQNV